MVKGFFKYVASLRVACGTAYHVKILDMCKAFRHLGPDYGGIPADIREFPKAPFPPSA